MEEDRKTLGKNLGCFVVWHKCYASFVLNRESDEDDVDGRAAIRTELRSLCEGKHATPPSSPHRDPSPKILPPTKTRKINSSTRSRSQSSQKDASKMPQKVAHQIFAI